MKESIKCVNSIFEQPWWLDAVAPGQWDAVEIIKNERVIARLPFVRQKRLGFKLLGMPDYTQTLGYWIDETGGKNTNKYTRRKELISELIEKLPKDYQVDFALDHTCDYLFPFRWDGFSLQMAYSYRIEDLQDIDLLWNGLAGNIRREIKKAQKSLSVEDDHPIDDLVIVQNKTFQRQGRKLRDSSELLKRVDKAAVSHNARKLLCAIDREGKLHAASYFVFDANCCYYLIGGGDPDLRTSGAASLLMWEAIKFASTVTKTFDFEGSMIKSIERFFRAFGGVPTPYCRVTKFNLPLYAAEYMKPKVKKFIGWE